MATVTTPEPVRPQAAKATIGPWGFGGFAVTSFGGPLALAGLIAPAVVADAGANAGIVTVAAAVVFGAPLAIWLDYSRTVHGSGGLYDYVKAAAGQRVALLQAAIWTFSYLLYVAYTTVQIVYDLLPSVLPGERQYQTALALLIPALLAVVVIAGTRTWLIAAGLIGFGQLALALILGGVTVAHLSPLVSGVSAHEPVDGLLKPIGMSSLFYICGSLPLFLGGELARPSATIRRGLLAAFGATVFVVLLAVAPLAGSPDLLGAPVPGVAVAERFVGSGLGPRHRHRHRVQHCWGDARRVRGTDTSGARNRRLAAASGERRDRRPDDGRGRGQSDRPRRLLHDAAAAFAGGTVAQPTDRVPRLSALCPPPRTLAAGGSHAGGDRECPGGVRVVYDDRAARVLRRAQPPRGMVVTTPDVQWC